MSLWLEDSLSLNLSPPAASSTSQTPVHPHPFSCSPVLVPLFSLCPPHRPRRHYLYASPSSGLASPSLASLPFPPSSCSSLTLHCLSVMRPSPAFPRTVLKASDSSLLLVPNISRAAGHQKERLQWELPGTREPLSQPRLVEGNWWELSCQPVIHLLRCTLNPGFRRSQFGCIWMEFYRNSKVIGSCISMNLVTPTLNIKALLKLCFKIGRLKQVLFVSSILFLQHFTEEWYNPLISVVRSVEAIKASCRVCGGKGGFFTTEKLYVSARIIYILQIHRLNWLHIFCLKNNSLTAGKIPCA